MRKVVVVALLAAASRASAAQAVAVSIEELTRASDAVVRGRVLATTPRRSDDGLRTYTAVELRSDAILRGGVPARVQVVVPGGVVGRFGQLVDAAPSFGTGEQVLVFLERAGRDAFRVTGLAQGKFTVSGGKATPDLSHFTFVRTTVPAGERRAEQMPLAELERRVRSIR